MRLSTSWRSFRAKSERILNDLREVVEHGRPGRSRPAPRKGCPSQVIADIGRRARPHRHGQAGRARQVGPRSSRVDRRGRGPPFGDARAAGGGRVPAARQGACAVRRQPSGQPGAEAGRRPCHPHRSQPQGAHGGRRHGRGVSATQAEARAYLEPLGLEAAYSVVSRAGGEGGRRHSREGSGRRGDHGHARPLGAPRPHPGQHGRAAHALGGVPDPARAMTGVGAQGPGAHLVRAAGGRPVGRCRPSSPGCSDARSRSPGSTPTPTPPWSRRSTTWVSTRSASRVCGTDPSGPGWRSSPTISTSRCSPPTTRCARRPGGRRSPPTRPWDPGRTGRTTLLPRLNELRLFLGPRWIISVGHLHDADYDELAERMRRQVFSRERGASFIAYHICEWLVESLQPALERLDDRIDALEDQVVLATGEAPIQELFGLKRDLVDLRRRVAPLRDVMQRLGSHGVLYVEPEAEVYFRDVHDDVMRVIELLDTYRDILSSALDLHLSSVSNRLNRVMKQLTVVATMFMPLSFIVGLFGTNFDSHALRQLRLVRDDVRAAVRLDRWPSSSTRWRRT